MAEIRNDPKYNYEVCQRCFGDGIAEVLVDQEIVEGPCPACDSLGYVIERLQRSRILAPGIVYTYEISEATDAAEWAVLSAGNKTAYAMILSTGLVDLTDGTTIRATLWAMFDAQSTTRANLIILLGE